MHSMIFSHISYCITSLSQTGKTTLAPLQTLYKQTLKVLDKKPLKYHHCKIIQRGKLYMHSMIFSHISYCITSLSQTGKTTLAPLQTLYKQTLKVLDKKPLKYHHCKIIQRHNLMIFDSFVFLADVFSL